LPGHGTKQKDADANRKGFHMTKPAGTADASDPAVLHNAIALATSIRAAADQIETERRLPDTLVRKLEEAGIFGMAMPRSWGGPELDPLTQFRVIEALGMADGSVAWCAMINVDGGYFTAFLEQEVARAMYPDIRVGTAVTATPVAQAVAVKGGYRVSGTSAFVSGSHHCECVFVGCKVTKEGVSQLSEMGVPITRQCLVRLSQCEILDTWHTTGLRGTGSNDIRMTDVFVPAEHTFSFQDPNLIKRKGPLYAFPFMFFAKASAPALGVARHALDALIEIVGQKPARLNVSGNQLEPPKLMREAVFVQDAVGRAETMLASARAYQFETMGSLWQTFVENGEPTPAQIARFTTAANHVMGVCVDVVQLVCKAAGGTAIYQKGPFDRCLRDALTINQHAIASLRTYEMAGRLLLGLEPLRILV
jgi:alkylation response protein AidB-like acyl-CoA dehydrogenase